MIVWTYLVQIINTKFKNSVPTSENTLHLHYKNRPVNARQTITVYSKNH